MWKTILLTCALTLAGIVPTSCAQTNITEDQAVSIAEKHLQRYGHYPDAVTRIEATVGEGWSNQYWVRFDQPAIQGKKQVCWVVRFYYSGPGLDGQLLVFVDKSNGDVIGGTQTQSANLTSPQIPTSPNTTQPNFRNLSDSEKSKAIQIALNTTEAASLIQNGTPYTSTLSWVGIIWNGTNSGEVYGFDYNAVETGIPPGIPKNAIIYPRVELEFGNPPNTLIRVAVDLSAGTAVWHDVHGLKR